MSHETCAQCGFDGAVFDDDGLVAAVRALGDRWRAALDAGGPLINERPAPEVWSALEYAAHTRDITAVHVIGVQLALSADEPDLGPLDGDAAIAAAAANYVALDADTVVDEVAMNAQRLADVAAEHAGAEWERGIRVGGDRQTVRRLVEHALHDSHHHLDDIERGYARLMGDAPR